VELSNSASWDKVFSFFEKNNTPDLARILQTTTPTKKPIPRYARFSRVAILF